MVRDESKEDSGVFDRVVERATADQRELANNQMRVMCCCLWLAEGSGKQVVGGSQME